MTITKEYIRSGDTVVDATCGTGQDTVQLAQAVGGKGLVYAFDVQQEALNLTEERLLAEGIGNVNLIHDSFTKMANYVSKESASVVVFNLGYLPGGDHNITTNAEDTIEGLTSALDTIRHGGIVTVVLYDGHEEGTREKKRVLEWAQALDSAKHHTAYVSMTNQNNNPPEILWITKK